MATEAEPTPQASTVPTNVNEDDSSSDEEAEANILNTVWVGGIPEEAANEASLRAAFADFGLIMVVTVRVKTTAMFGPNKSWAFVRFEQRESAIEAQASLVNVSAPDGDVSLKVTDNQAVATMGSSKGAMGSVWAEQQQEVAFTKMERLNRLAIHRYTSGDGTQSDDLSSDEEDVEDPSTTVWVGGIPESSASEEKMRSAFASFGEVLVVTVRVKETAKHGPNKSWAFVRFAEEESAALAQAKEPVVEGIVLKVRETQYHEKVLQAQKGAGALAGIWQEQQQEAAFAQMEQMKV
eukprot:SAG31_NODE_924_length_10963_cov_4.339286_4_plen_294_part_00